ncbi:uncharacterized protein LOC105426728 [Pogonomyrmex barbatus]|uniref:Uncharacterized protein LOC105426728 n=1 Tax=Pogonomyrmex barbatus TaxID=144034 RepID=A0A8N1S4U2_9HYME|nr:uncharacterized protein LOC105426728 [Pogonomyrmex barbatus]
MKALFNLCADNVNDLLPYLKNRLMSGKAQVVKEILKFLEKTEESKRNVIVEKLVKFDVIFVMCNMMQTSDEDFVKAVLECFKIVSAYKEFYENQAAIIAVESMLRLSYCIHKSLKNSRLFEKLVENVSYILAKSLKLDVNLDTSCILQQVVFFVKNLNIKDLQKDDLKFAAVTMLNVVLQKQETFDEDTDMETIIDICHNALKSMTDIVKYGDDDNTILFAADLLCSTCACSSRFCLMQDSSEENQTQSQLKICQRIDRLESCVYNTMMDLIIPLCAKNADLSRVDSIGFHRSLISCLNNLYQLKNCNKDDLSNHLTVNGYLKRFLYLSVSVPENLRRSICTLLSRILSTLGKAAFSINKIQLANILQRNLVELLKDPKERWNDVVASREKNGSILIILLYYHYFGTQEYGRTIFFYITVLFLFNVLTFMSLFRSNVVSLESLIARIMLLPRTLPISDVILKPLLFLFAVTSLAHPRPHLLYHYENAITKLMNILQRLDISKFYTHHIDLLRYCLECPNISQNLMNQILNLWLIESDGDVKPLLFNCNKVVQHLLMVIHTDYFTSVIHVAAKGLRQFIQIMKDDKQLIDQVADKVWRMLPNILSSYQSDYVAHIDTVLELANITRPSTIPIPFIIRSADYIVNIILKKNIDSKLMTLFLTQAYILLDAAVSCKSFEVLKIYIQKFLLLKQLYVYGFSEQRSQLSTASIKLLAYILHCQKESLIKCRKPLKVHIKDLVQMLNYARISPDWTVNEMLFICELLTSDNNKSAIILQNITTKTDDVYMLINLYEMLHLILPQKDPISKDIVYQSLLTLLEFCNVNVPTLMQHLCTVMSNYELIFNVNIQQISCHFLKFITAWLHYRKANCKDVLWNPRKLYKTPFDEALDKLKEYSIILNDKGMENAYQDLQSALSQFQ